MDADAAAFHSAEPGHLAFGKLMDGCGEGLLHLVETEFAGEIEGDEFVLQAVVDEVFGRDRGTGWGWFAGERVGVRWRAFEEAADFIYHTLAQAGVKTSVDAGVAELAGDECADVVCLLGQECRTVHRVLRLINRNFKGSNQALAGVVVGAVVEGFESGEPLNQLLSGKLLHFLAKFFVFRHIRQGIAAGRSLYIES